MQGKYNDIIVQTIGRIMVPFIQFFGLYVIMHGHISPGGGFQGGVILGSSIILLAITDGEDAAKKYLSPNAILVFCCLGLIIYGGIGVCCLWLGGNYLDYGRLPVGETIPKARYWGIFGIELGVGFTVMATMVSIFYSLVAPKQEC